MVYPKSSRIKGGHQGSTHCKLRIRGSTWNQQSKTTSKSTRLAVRVVGGPLMYQNSQASIRFSSVLKRGTVWNGYRTPSVQVNIPEHVDTFWKREIGEILV